jgi:hypothetical protein
MEINLLDQDRERKMTTKLKYFQASTIEGIAKIKGFANLIKGVLQLMSLK